MSVINIGQENEQVEYKKSTAELREGIISMVAILNKHGYGELFFGVKNNGDVVGQQISDKTLRDKLAVTLGRLFIQRWFQKDMGIKRLPM